VLDSWDFLQIYFVRLDSVVVGGSKVICLEPKAEIIELAKQEHFPSGQQRLRIGWIYSHVDQSLKGFCFIGKDVCSGSGSVVVGKRPELHGGTSWVEGWAV
jgi:hypothetical protein